MHARRAKYPSSASSLSSAEPEGHYSHDHPEGSQNPRSSFSSPPTPTISHTTREMSASPMASRSRVTRVELTADQLLGPGPDLTPARLHKQRKNAPKLITVEELLGPSLTIAGPSSRSSSSSRAATSPRSPSSSSPRPARRPIARSPSPRRIAVPHRERVTADEVLRTGLPLRTLQAAKARARNAQAMVLTAEQLHASGGGGGSGSGSSSTSGSRLSSPSPSSSGRPRVVTAEELAGLEPRTSSRRPRSAGGDPAAVSHPSGVRSGSGAGTSRVPRPSTAGATVGSGGSAAGRTGAAGSSGTAGGRGSRSGRIQRSSSQGSTRTLPMYTKEPGESEVVIDRGTEELEDEIPITVMTPVVEDAPSFANVSGLPDSAGPSSPVFPVFTRGADPAQPLSLRPLDAISPIPIPISPTRTILNGPMASIVYADEVPSYEAAISMSSSPDLRLANGPRTAPADVPLPASPHGQSPGPALSPRSPALSIPAGGRSGAPSPSPSSPSSPVFGFGSSSPPSPSAEGAESPRKRFPFLSLFPSHSHGHGGGSASRSRSRGGSVSTVSVSGLPSPPAPTAGGTTERASPSPPSPRPLHRSSHSASGSMLDLLSRSWSDSSVVRSRSDRSGA